MSEQSSFTHAELMRRQSRTTTTQTTGKFLEKSKVLCLFFVFVAFFVNFSGIVRVCLFPVVHASGCCVPCGTRSPDSWPSVLASALKLAFCSPSAFLVLTMDPSVSLAKLSAQLNQWNTRSQRPPQSAYTASTLDQATTARGSSAVTRDNVGALQNGLRQWSSGWEQTLKRLRHVAAPQSPVAHSALLLPEPAAAQRKSRPLAERTTVKQDDHDNNRLRLADIKRALEQSDDADDATFGRPAAGLGQFASEKMHSQQLLLHDIAETGRVAELELQHKKATSELEHRLRAEVTVCFFAC